MTPALPWRPSTTAERPTLRPLLARVLLFLIRHASDGEAERVMASGIASPVRRHCPTCRCWDLP